MKRREFLKSIAAVATGLVFNPFGKAGPKTLSRIPDVFLTPVKLRLSGNIIEPDAICYNFDGSDNYIEDPDVASMSLSLDDQIKLICDNLEGRYKCVSVKENTITISSC